MTLFGLYSFNTFSFRFITIRTIGPTFTPTFQPTSNPSFTPTFSPTLQPSYFVGIHFAILTTQLMKSKTLPLLSQQIHKRQGDEPLDRVFEGNTFFHTRKEEDNPVYKK